MGRGAQRRRRGGQQVAAEGSTSMITAEDALYDSNTVEVSFSGVIPNVTYTPADLMIMHDGHPIYPITVVRNAPSTLLYTLPLGSPSVEDDIAVLTRAPAPIFSPTSLHIGT